MATAHRRKNLFIDAGPRRAWRVCGSLCQRSIARVKDLFLLDSNVYIRAFRDLVFGQGLQTFISRSCRATRPYA